VAKLLHMPDSATIMASRRRVDYYLWMGIPVARSWPRKSTQPRTAGEIASSEAFKAAAVMTGAVGSNVRDAYKVGMVGHGVTWVDRFRGAAGGKSWIRLGD